METLPEDLAFRIIKYFQGSSSKNRILEKAQKATQYQFDILIKHYREHSELKTDIKSLISLAETNRFFFNLIRKSDLGKSIWIAYYNSLFPLTIQEDSVHIGDQTWAKCGNSLEIHYPGIGKINNVITTPRCTNPMHYINNDHRTRVNWNIDALFKKIAIRKFVMLKNEGPDFTRNHETRLNRLYSKLESIQVEIRTLERRKEIANLDLGNVFKHWVTDHQLCAYRERKNRLVNLNHESYETESSKSETESYWTDSNSEADSISS